MRPTRKAPRAAFAPILLPAIAALAFVAGCADTKPANIRFTAPPPAVTDVSAFYLHAAVVNAKGEPIPGQAIATAASPQDVLAVAADGALKCLKTGEAKVTLAGGGLEASVPVRCRVPTMIEMPASLRLVLKEAPVRLGAKALGEGGAVLKDVAVPLTSSDPAIVAVDGGAVRPVALGRTTVRGALGVIAGMTRVEVVERVVSERVDLADGMARDFRLSPGTYEVEVDVRPSVRVSHGVTLSWAGNACPAQPEQASHRAACRLLEEAALSVRNPPQLGIGARLAGTVTIYRVPEAD